ncbi:MAG: hypothetical protein R2688_06155 [Fimbriimonadaceae bacterium]
MPDRPPMLYNIKQDPQEMNNRFAENPDLAANLFKKLFAWEKDMIYPRWNTAPIWYQDNAQRYDRDGLLTQPPGKPGL